MEDMDIPIQHIGLVTTQRLMSKNPDVVRRTVKSYVEGIQALNRPVARRTGNRPSTAMPAHTNNVTCKADR